MGVPEVEEAFGCCFRYCTAFGLFSSSRFSQGCYLVLVTCTSFSKVSSIVWKCGG
jgi:hypothetical protein